MERINLYIMSGLPSSGKTTFAKERLNNSPNNTVYISRDEIRESLLKDSDDYWSKEKEVYSIFWNRINDCLKNKKYKNIYVDATHATVQSRAYLLEHLNIEPDTFVQIICMATPLDICLKREKARKRKFNSVSNMDEVIESMYENMEKPSYYEGFHRIIYVETYA